MLEGASKWLSNLWIISVDSGVCIFEQNFMDITMNPDLISGFLVAMLNFGRELASKDLQEIQFNGLRISFKTKEKFIIAVATKDEAPEHEVNSFIALVDEEFTKRYDDKLSDWHGDVDIFEDFGIFIENLINKKALTVELVKKKIIKKIEEAPETPFIKNKLAKFDEFLAEKKAELENIKDVSVTEIDRLKVETFKHITEKWEKIKSHNFFKP